MTVRLRRSELSTPGHNKKMVDRAATSEADLVFLDLEDSVAPAQKEEARAAVIQALSGLDWGTKTRAVRVNATDTPWHRDDLRLLVGGVGNAVDVVILPKVKTAEEVERVATTLTQLEQEHRIMRPIALEVLIEEAEGLVNVEGIAKASPRVEALIFGPGDFSASQGVRWGLAKEAAYPGDIWAYHRSRIVVAARAAGIDAVDGPFANFRDPDGYRAEALRAALMGFVGKWAIHPSQIEIANEVFSPTAAEVKAASDLVRAYEEAEAEGSGAAGVGGVMIDAATARIMQGILERARLIEGAPDQEEDG